MLPVKRTYAKTDSATTPHGSDTQQNTTHNHLMLERAGVPHLTINHDGSSGIVDMSSWMSHALLHPNSREVQSLAQVKDVEADLLRHFLSTVINKIFIQYRAGLNVN